MLVSRPLEPRTWPDFEALVERNNGVWGGCWCMGFHAEGAKSAENRSRKRARVDEGRAHAALVYDGATAVGWCQFGSPDELPRIKHKRAYGEPELPDWRITCFFTDSRHRRHGVADTALAGALEQIARLGGGTVESYPEDTAGRTVSNSFLHNGTLALFERHGFTPRRRLGKHHWIVSRAVP